MPTITPQTTTDTLVELLSHLIRFPTVSSDTATNRAALDWVQEQLSGLALTVKRLENHGHPALIATTQATRNPRLWLLGHMDTVPAAASAFNPTVREGRLHGRGSYDMKFAIATFIALLQELGPKLARYDLGLMITTDEETGGYDGAKWLLEDQNYRGQAVLVPDSGGSWEMEMGSKGIMWWELTARGRAAHASRPWEGQNAIDDIVRFVDHVRTNLKPEPCGDRNHAHTTLNLATISGGTVANQVPASATARLDLRFTPDITLDTITAWIAEAQSLIPSVEAKPLLADPPYQVKNNGPVALFRQIAESTIGRPLTPTVAHGSSDARHFARHGISTINVCPTGSGFHAPDEWVDIADLGRFYTIVRQFTEQWAKR
jgi:succinyl-diaminopimelate desuccinylase